MASQVPSFAASFAELAVALLSSSEVTPRARLIAQEVSDLLGDAGVVVYLLDQSGDAVWMPRATAGDVAFEETAINLYTGTLGILAKEKKAVVFPGANLPREKYSHLNVRRTVVSFAGVPMLRGNDLVGAVEVLSFDHPITESNVAALREIAQLGALGLAAGMAYESERNASLESITRLSQLYDLEKVFNSTLEMSNLMALITSKFREILNVQAVNLWMVEGDDVRLTSRSGVDNTVELDAVRRGGQGLIGDLADQGEPVLIDTVDERVQQRNADVQEGAIFSYMGAPLMHGGAEVGFVEAINKTDGTPFDDTDLFFLTTINETASNALHNASLLLAERKVQILETLVTVSQEITSTLDLGRVMQAVVNGPQAVIPYERAAIALEQHGRLRLGAVSGVEEINLKDPAIAPLNDMLQWAAMSSEGVFVRQHGDKINTTREETRAKFERYFSDTGMRAFYALPLADDTGRVGVLAFESSDPDFLSEAHLEMVKVLAGQATVALRNAQMYKEVPFIDILQPMLERKRKFLAMEKQRRAATVALACAGVLFLVFVPLPMRVDGNASVAAARTAQVQPQVAGVVKKVYVREGQAVKQGDVLADLEDWDYRGALAEAQAKYLTATSEMNRALAANDGSEAGIKRVQADYWASELKRAQERLDSTHLRSAISGVVTTPHIENFVGRHLAVGDTFAQVMDTSSASVDVAIEDKEAPLLRAGTKAAVKLEGYPARTFRGRVEVVSPKSAVEEDQRVYFARVSVPNVDGAIRPGMRGRGKVSVGWHAAGYVFFRGSALWLYSKLWSWFGW